MLGFVESLKQVIADVQVTGGAIVERSSLSPDLLQRLREYAVQQVAVTERGKHVLLEWFTEGFFGEYVRACAIHLRKLGITDDELVYRLITRVIDLSLSGKYPFASEVRDFEEQLVVSLFEVWEQMGDEQTVTYTFAQERWLIAWDYQKSQWKATGLGRLLLELSPVQAAIFLLSIDTIFSIGKHDFRHISADVLRGAFRLQPDSDETPHLIPLHHGVLARLGILEEPSDYHPDRIRLTPVGKIVVDRVLSEDNPFRDAAKSLIETEALGDTFQGSSLEIEDVVRIVNSSDLVDDANRKSIARSVQLHQAGQYLDALRLLYPSIEAIVNAMLVRAGEQPEHFRGLANKVQWLEQQKLIPADVSSAVEIFTGRNKVLHGNFAPPAEYVFPVCLLAFRYLRRLLMEYRPAS